MRRNEKARQPRGIAVTGPVGEPCAAAGSPDHHSTGGVGQCGSSTLNPSCGASSVVTASTEAETLLGVTSWLAAARDWLEEEIDLARGRLGLEAGDAGAEHARLPVRLSDAEHALDGLRGVVGLLDGLSIDPSRVRTFGTPAHSSSERLQ